MINPGPYLANITDSNAICIPVEALAKLQASSLKAFNDAVFLYIFIGIAIGITFTLGGLYIMDHIDTWEDRGDKI